MLKDVDREIFRDENSKRKKSHKKYKGLSHEKKLNPVNIEIISSEDDSTIQDRIENEIQQDKIDSIRNQSISGKKKKKQI